MRWRLAIVGGLVLVVIGVVLALWYSRRHAVDLARSEAAAFVADDRLALYVESFYPSTRVILAEVDSETVIWKTFTDGTEFKAAVTGDERHVYLVGRSKANGVEQLELRVLKMSNGESVIDRRVGLPPGRTSVGEPGALSNDLRWFAQVDHGSEMHTEQVGIHSLADGACVFRQPGGSRHFPLAFSPNDRRLLWPVDGRITGVAQLDESRWSELAQFEGRALTWDGDDTIWAYWDDDFVRWTPEGATPVYTIPEGKRQGPKWYASRDPSSGELYGVVTHYDGAGVVELKSGRRVLTIEESLHFAYAAGVYNGQLRLLGVGLSGSWLRAFDLQSQKLVLDQAFQAHEHRSTQYNLGSTSVSYAHGRFTPGGKYMVYRGASGEPATLTID